MGRGDRAACCRYRWKLSLSICLKSCADGLAHSFCCLMKRKKSWKGSYVSTRAIDQAIKKPLTRRPGASRMMRYDEGLFIQLSRCMPVVTLVQLGDAIAAGACFFSFSGQCLTDIHWRAGNGRHRHTPHRLQILRLVSVYLLYGGHLRRKRERMPDRGLR